MGGTIQTMGISSARSNIFATGAHMMQTSISIALIGSRKSRKCTYGVKQVDI